MTFFGVVDIIIIIGILVMGVIGFSKGLNKKIINIASFVLAFLSLVFLSAPLIKLFGCEESEFKIKSLFYIGSFIIVFILIRILGGIFNKKIENKTGGYLNRFLGAIWGMSEALLVIWVVMLLVSFFCNVIPGIKNAIPPELSLQNSSTLTAFLYKNNLIPTIVEKLNNE